jgi:hypothetical protein
MTHDTGNNSWNRRKGSSKGFIIGGHRYSQKLSRLGAGPAYRGVEMMPRLKDGIGEA